MYDEYVENPGFGFLNPIVRFFFKLLVRPLRKGDYRAAQTPDYFVTISEYAKGLMAKYYDREAIVIHPPVEVDDFKIKTKSVNAFSSDYYIITSRQVNWKRIDLVVKACMKLGRKLLVVGEGPEHNNLVKMSNGSEWIEFLPLQGKRELAKLLASAKGYLFPSLEPFGIAPVEALAVGCPVIAFREGGACDYINEGINGTLFDKQTVKSLTEAILRFEKMKFDRGKIVKTAEKFSLDRFDKEVRKFVDEKTA